jgi:hypothetical protein
LLAIVYLSLASLVGDIALRRFFRFRSWPHRVASAFLVGLLVSTFATYFFSLAFWSTERPLLYGNVLFFLSAGSLAAWAFTKGRREPPAFAHRTDVWDLVSAAGFMVASAWFMFGTFRFHDGRIWLHSFLWNDFGPNLALVRSFSAGHNFPTEYPHFIGEPIRYHFLFWFQTGNLEFLGLDIAWSLNLLSTLSMAAMLVLIAELGRVIFGSRAVGSIGASLFFFAGTLFYVPFLMQKASLAEAASAIVSNKEWLRSVFTYAGEQWGIWSMGTFLAQRHLAAAIGILIFILIPVVEHIKERSSAEISGPPDASPLEGTKMTAAGFLFCGVLLGMLVLWNGAIFLAGVVLLGSVFLIFGGRLRMLSLLAAAIVVAVPQILFLRAGTSRGMVETLRFGYVVDPPTIFNTLTYLAFTFGPKLAVAAIALFFLTRFELKLFAAFSSLLVFAFTTQLSTDVMNNHKFINVWLILLNLFVAYGIWRLAKVKFVGVAAAVVVFLAISFGGIIEMFRIPNDNVVDMIIDEGPLFEWIYTRTEPKDVFLTERMNHHPILLAGRKIFYGWPYFGWSMGHQTGPRDVIYERLYTVRDPDELAGLLHDNGISYVAVDDGVRNSHLKGRLNTTTLESHFEKVFVDTEKKYGSLVIYKVPPR